MTIETILNRLADAAERQAAAMEAVVRLNLEAATQILETVDAPAVQTADIEVEKPKTYAEERKAEVKAEAKAVAAEKKGRGRPRKETVAVEPEPEVVEEAADEEDPFAEAAAEPVKAREVTKEDLRATMVKLRDKVGKDKAYAFLREHGNGATFLPGSTASGVSGGAGELKPEFWLAVVTEAEKLLA